ncbi:Uncharacterised protein [Salmonella enterica subsp. enterica serovar Typhimurium str. DT104]|nr:Uncharacterised protein [Salmonella enterica subsp. enterica serovar Typhimurium str. DT104]
MQNWLCTCIMHLNQNFLIMMQKLSCPVSFLKRFMKKDCPPLLLVLCLMVFVLRLIKETHKIIFVSN